MDEFKDGVRIYSIDKNQEEMTIYLGDLKRFHNEYLELKEIEKEHQRINGELRVENKELKGSLQTYEILLKTNIEESQELKDRIDNTFDVINTQMKTADEGIKENLRIIKFNLIKGSCTFEDLKTEEDYKY